MKHDHDLVKGTNGKYQCRVCGKEWKGKNPQTYCTGVWIYPRLGAPENLKTKGQLKKMGLKPGGPVRAVVGQQEWPLYDLKEATAIPAEEIAAEKERKRKERHAARYRSCKHCGREVKKEKYNNFFHSCPDCLDGVRKAFHEELQRKEEEERAEFEKFLIQEKDRAIQTARDWLRLGDQAVILDTETTGLDGEAIEIGIVDLEGKVLVNQRVNPRGEISEGAFRVHGISKEMLADCPAYDQVFPQVSQAVQGKTVIVYNAAFDANILSFSGYGYHLPQLKCQWVCAMELYAQYYGEWSDYHRSFRWQKLQGGDHSAVGDCQATLELLKRMAEANQSGETADV